MKDKSLLFYFILFLLSGFVFCFVATKVYYDHLGLNAGKFGQAVNKTEIVRAANQLGVLDIQQVGDYYIDWLNVQGIQPFGKANGFQLGFRSDGLVLWHFVDKDGRPMLINPPEKTPDAREEVEKIAKDLKTDSEN